LLSICRNSKLCEEKILEVFKQTFIQEKFYGREYFSGNADDMIYVMIEFIKLYNNQQHREEDLDLELQN